METNFKGTLPGSKNVPNNKFDQKNYQKQMDKEMEKQQ